MAMLKGLKKLYYAILTKDDLTGVAYGAVSPLAGVNKASVKRKNNTDIFYAENGPWESATSAVNWTFNEAIQYSTVIASNFMVAADVAGTLVSGSLSVNAGRTVVTFTPTVNLTAATAYRAIVTSGVKDLAGNSLATSITKFTTS